MSLCAFAPKESLQNNHGRQSLCHQLQRKVPPEAALNDSCGGIAFLAAVEQMHVQHHSGGMEVLSPELD